MESPGAPSPEQATVFWYFEMDLLSLQLGNNMNKNLPQCIKILYLVLCVMKGTVLFPAHVYADLTLISVLYEIYMDKIQV